MRAKMKSEINPETKPKMKPDRKLFWYLVIKLAVLVGILWLLLGVVFGITPMANADMQPAVCAGDLMLYYRFEPQMVSGDVVVFDRDEKTYTGRIVAVGGDTVEITGQSELKVNGSTIVENNIYYSTPAYDSEIEYPLTLAEDQYFILGDSREGARDSRFFGAVEKDEIKGKVITIIRRSGI